MKKNIAVIGGGYSSEKVVAVKSMQTIIDHIDTRLYTPYAVHIEKDSWYVDVEGESYPVDKNTFSVQLNGKEISFDAAYITIHGTPGEDGRLQGYLDMMGIPYTTPSHTASAITFDKWACTSLLRSHGIETAHGFLLRKGDEINIDELLDVTGIPCFVKPNDGGSSFGVSKVRNKEMLKEAIKVAFTEGNEVLVEHALNGIEVTCGCVLKEGTPIVFPVTEIVSDNDFFDYEAKYEGRSSEITPARLSQEQTLLVQETTKKIYKLLGLKGIVRIDFMLLKETLYMIEVNTTPGLSPASIIPQQANEMGMSLKELFSIAIKEALHGAV